MTNGNKGSSSWRYLLAVVLTLAHETSRQDILPPNTPKKETNLGVARLVQIGRFELKLFVIPVSHNCLYDLMVTVIDSQWG